MDERHSSAPPRPRDPTLTERQAAEELGLDKMQLYLAAAKQKLGHYDPLTHLLIFSDLEVDALAAQLGIVRRRRQGMSAAEQAKIPEPNGE